MEFPAFRVVIDLPGEPTSATHAIHRHDGHTPGRTPRSAVGCHRFGV